MQFGASSSLGNILSTGASERREPSPHGLQPDMHPLSLSFRSALLEHDYLHAMRQQTTAVVRFGILLALVVFLLFGVLDLWIAPEHARLSLAVRAVVFVSTALLLALSFTSLFERYREQFVLPFCLLLGGGLTALLSAIPGSGADYYAGYMLIIVGAYTVLGLRFINATFVALALLGMYLAVEFLVNANAAVERVNNAAYIVSTLIITAVGGYLYERQRRLAHFRLRLIEQERARSEHSALHDPLTGLPNRRLLTERLAHAIARDKRNHTYSAVLFIDLDNFKPVNDAHGHVFGDRLLRCVGERLRQVVRDTDTVTRVGGDEFVVLLEDLYEAEAATRFKDRLMLAFAAPFMIDDKELTVAMSVGCAVDPIDARTPDDLLRCADRAMYAMKQTRGRR